MRRFSILLVVAGLALAACGGGDSDDTANGGGPVQSPAGGGNLGGAIDAAHCVEIATAMADAAAAVPQVIAGTGSDLETSVEQLQAFVDAAPEEIRADFQVVFGAYAKFVEVLQNSGYDPTSGQPPSADVAAALQRASEAFNTDDYTQALNRVNAFFANNCST